MRTLLIWLLVLALPAQGMAAAAMVFCGPNHHDRASPAAVVHDAGAAHAHHEATDPQAGPTASDETAAHKFSQPQMQKCSACAACCSAAAIHDTVPLPPVLEPAAPHFAALSAAVEPFATDGPDRPPRPFLA